MRLAHAESSAPAGARAFFGEVCDAADAAAGRAGGWRARELTIDATRVRLRFAGESMLDALFPALAHLAGPPTSEADVTITLWDTASNGVALPALPWWAEDIDVRIGRVREEAVAPLHAYHNVYARTITLYDEATASGVHWAADAGQIPWYERGSALRTAFHLALPGPDRQLVHAGAVGTDAGCVLLGGPSGSGKTTTALACVDAGLAYAGDDYVLVSLAPRPVAHSLYSTAKADPVALRRFPSLAACVEESSAGEDKAVLNLLRGRGDQVRASMPLTAIVLPRVCGTGGSALTPMSASEAIRDLAPSTLIQMPHRSAEVLAGIARLLEAVPSYRLELGSDPRDAVSLIHGLLGA